MASTTKKPIFFNINIASNETVAMAATKYLTVSTPRVFPPRWPQASGDKTNLSLIQSLQKRLIEVPLIEKSRTRRGPACGSGI